MTLPLSHQPVLRAAVQSVLNGMLGAPVDTNTGTQDGNRLGVLYQEMTAAGDRLGDALRLEQEFNKIDLTQLERWRLHRQTVECMAQKYASAVSNWRDALLLQCRGGTRQRFRPRWWATASSWFSAVPAGASSDLTRRMW